MTAESESRASTGGGAIPHRGVSTLLGLVLPMVVTLVTCGWVLSWSGELPDPVASHWSGGTVDRTTPLTTMILIVGGMAGLCSLGGWALAVRNGREATVRRIGVGFALGLSVFLSGMLLATLWPQRGLATAAVAPATLWAPLASVGAGLLAATLGALAMPSDPPAPLPPTHVRRGVRRPDPRLPWVRRVHARGTTALAAVCVLGALAVGIVSDSLLVLVPLAALVGLLMLALARITVTIDTDGLRASGLLGWPHLFVPAEEILETHSAWVNPVRDYGGLGYRTGAEDEVVLVIRVGEALKVTRTGLRAACVSVDDSTLAAELLRDVARAATTWETETPGG